MGNNEPQVIAVSDIWRRKLLWMDHILNRTVYHCWLVKAHSHYEISTRTVIDTIDRLHGSVDLG